MTTETKVEAVAWLDDEDMPWRSQQLAARFSAYAPRPLVMQSALDALRGEVERLRGINTTLVDKCNRLNLSGAQSDQRADAAERRVAELEAGAQAVVLAFEALGESKGIVSDRSARRQCEATLVTLKSLLTKESP